MGLVLFGWLSDQNYFKDLTDIDVLNRLRGIDEQQTRDALVPFATVYNHQESAQQKTESLLGKNNPEGWTLDETWEPPIRIFF